MAEQHESEVNSTEQLPILSPSQSNLMRDKREHDNFLPVIISSDDSDDEDLEMLMEELKAVKKERKYEEKLLFKKRIKQKIAKTKQEIENLKAKTDRKVLIISDSFCKNITDIYDTEVRAFPGYNIGGITFLISTNQIEMSNYTHVIFHVGSCDVQRKTVNQMMAGYNNLVTLCRSKSHAEFIISSVLPRPVDFDTLGEKVKGVNTKLKQLCCDRHAMFVKSYKPFLSGGKPIAELFSPSDSLNLNLEGTRRLRHFFIQVINRLK